MKIIEAFVLRKTPLGEADLLLDLFTRELGKIKAIAKNAKKSRKRFGGTLEPFSLLKIQISERPSRMSLALDSQNVKSFGRFATDYDLFAWGGFVLETADILTPLEMPEPELFDLIYETLENLDALDKGAELLPTIIEFQLSALSISGIRPRFRVDSGDIGGDIERARETIKLLIEFTERHTGKTYSSKKLLMELKIDD